MCFVNNKIVNLVAHSPVDTSKKNVRLPLNLFLTFLIRQLFSAWFFRVHRIKDKWNALNCFRDDETLECCFLKEGWVDTRAIFYNYYSRTQHLNLLTASSVSVTGCNDWNVSTQEIGKQNYALHTNYCLPLTANYYGTTHRLNLIRQQLACDVWKNLCCLQW